MPVDTAGNLGGLYTALKDDPRYFRMVDLSDPAFEFRPVHFQVDGDYVDSFQDTINFVSVNFRKTYPDQPAFTRSLHFAHAEIKAGKTMQDVAFPRLGDDRRELDRVRIPGALEHPRRRDRQRARRRQVGEDARRGRVADAAVCQARRRDRRRPAAVRDARASPRRWSSSLTMLGGKPRLQRKAILRASDAAPTTKVSVYHDRQTPMAVRVTWHSPAGKTEGKLEVLESDYLFLTPPDCVGATVRGVSDDPRHRRRPLHPVCVRLPSAQQILIDRGMRAGGLWCFPLATEPKTYVYLPSAARLATGRCGTAAVLVRPLRRPTMRAAGGTASITESGGGGVLHFLVLMETPERPSPTAQQELRRIAKDDEVKLRGPMVFSDGRYALVSSVLSRSTATPERKLLATGRAPVLEGNRIAFSFDLKPTEATLLLRSFEMRTPDVSIVFDMTFTGLTDAYDADLTIDWTEVRKHQSFSAGGIGVLRGRRRRPRLRPAAPQQRDQAPIERHGRVNGSAAEHRLQQAARADVPPGRARARRRTRRAAACSMPSPRC